MGVSPWVVCDSAAERRQDVAMGISLVITHENGVFEMDLRSVDTGND